MKVYLLEHHDIESDIYVRGVYLRAEDAEAGVTAKEWSDNWIIARAARERMRRGLIPDGHEPAGVQRWEYPVGVWHERPTEEVWNFRYFREHYDGCCGVTEVAVLEEAPAPEYGPFQAELRDRDQTGLIPRWVEKMLTDSMTRTFPRFP